MSLEVRFVQWLRQNVSWLFLGIYLVDRYCASVDKCSEVEQFVVKKLRPWANFVESCDFNCPTVVFKDLAMNFGLSVCHWESQLVHLL